MAEAPPGSRSLGDATSGTNDGSCGGGAWTTGSSGGGEVGGGGGGDASSDGNEPSPRKHSSREIGWISACIPRGGEGARAACEECVGTGSTPGGSGEPSRLLLELPGSLPPNACGGRGPFREGGVCGVAATSPSFPGDLLPTSGPFRKDLLSSRSVFRVALSCPSLVSKKSLKLRGGVPRERRPGDTGSTCCAVSRQWETPKGTW